MQLHLQKRLVAEIQEHLRLGTTHLADREYFNPVANYASTDIVNAESEKLFRRFPVIVGHASRLAEPGAFFTTQLDGTPLVVTRQADGSVRAFENICRHRGSRVVEECEGTKRRFSCPYHAWSYDIDGTLVSIPEADGFNGVDKSERGLIEVTTSIRHGFVWVQLEAEPIDVGSYLGPFDEELAAYRLDEYVEERETELRTEVNWKVVVDGFLEGYHLPFLHAKTISPYIRQKPTPFEAVGLHGRMVAVRKSFEEFVDADPEEVDLLPHIAIIYQLFPNTILVWQADHFEMWNCFPDDAQAGKSMSRVSLLAPDAEAAVGRSDYWNKNWTVLMNTVEQEDFRVGRTMQAGYAAGSQTTVVFGRNEPALQNFHRNLADQLT